MSRPESRQWAHVLGERAKERATTKSSCSHGIGRLQSASSATRGLGIVVTQTSEQGIKDIVL